MMIWNLCKFQSYKIEELCLMLDCTVTVHKSFVSTSLNIIHRGCTIHLSYPYWMVTSSYENTMSSITVTVHKLT
jgi:hypothetical protein